MNAKPGKKIYIAIAALIVWFAIGLQFNLSLKNNQEDFLKTLKIFFSYFTVTTNTIVGICLLALLFFENTRIGKFFNKSTTLTAIEVYIFVVGLVYNTLLRDLIVMDDWSRIANELLHVINPLIFTAFWIFYVEKSTLQYKNAKIWMIYPLVYMGFVVIRGAMIGQYPYPFINVVHLGYPTAILNAFLILLVFYGLSLLMIFLGNRFSKDN